jgi:hypothetical protein
MQKQIVLLCTALMFGYFFLALVLMALAGNCGDQVMRIRLTKKLPLENVFSWWMESSDEVGRAYQEMFPGSYLPSIVQWAFWVFLLAGAASY